MAQHFIKQEFLDGGIAVDATAGNGNDSLFLSRLIGPTGTLYAFDIQRIALEATRDKLSDFKGRLHLVLDSHHRMAEHISAENKGQVGAVMFNLGYLPGGAHPPIVTRGHTTVLAVQAAAMVTKCGGFITIVAYKHPAGREELELLNKELTLWPRNQFAILTSAVSSQSAEPTVICIRKLGHRKDLPVADCTYSPD